MDWNRDGLRKKTLDWLRLAKDDRHLRERRLDPFDTSMRDFDDASAQLVRIKKKEWNTEKKYKDKTQRLRDLRNAGLASGKIDDARLTPLGLATIDAWEEHGVANDNKDAELARTVLLISEALGREVPQYVEMFKYWSELRDDFGGVDLIANWDKLPVLTYLDVVRNGFAPGRTFREQEVSAGDLTYELSKLVEEGSDSATRQGEKRVSNQIASKSSRGRARATYCLAMELICTDPKGQQALLQRFGIPQKRGPTKDVGRWINFDEKQLRTLVDVLNHVNVESSVPTASASAIDAHADMKLPDSIDYATVLRKRSAPAKAGASSAKSGVNAKSRKKTDHTRQQALNDAIGRLGETFAMAFERWRLREHEGLLKRIEHVALEDDSCGYDIRSFEVDGSDRLVEVKATSGPIESRFFITRTERACARDNPDSYVVLRIGKLLDDPVCYELREPFDDLEFEASVYEVRFKTMKGRDDASEKGD